ncbi:MAG: ASCH domain-containing protein [Clostridia bacterium]|nr:ASCH domain-containing protein [Clostridia bacterium]
MIHEMKLREIYFNMIKNGSKIYEVRLNDEKRRLIDVGDTIIFKKEPLLKEELVTKVKDIVYFKNFEELVNTLPLEKIGFKTESKQEVEDIYHSFYSPEEEQKYGVVAIKVITK